MIRLIFFDRLKIMPRCASRKSRADLNRRYGAVGFWKIGGLFFVMIIKTDVMMYKFESVEHHINTVHSLVAHLNYLVITR